MTLAFNHTNDTVTPSTGLLTAAGSVGFTNSATYMTKDGSGNMEFNDAVTGTKTLAELAAGGGGDSLDPLLFGDGSDGDVTISSATTTLTRDMYYNNLTMDGTGKIECAAYRIYVAGTLDLTAAPANSITVTPVAGNDANGIGMGGATIAGVAYKTIGGCQQGQQGQNGGTAAGATGNTGMGAISSGCVVGGNGGSGGTGGNGSGGNGGGSGTPKTRVTQSGASYHSIDVPCSSYGLIALSVLGVGGGGATGGSGGGDGTAGGGSGGAARSGGGVYVAAKTISRGASTTAGCISATVGKGGNGGVPDGGNRGGGAGAGGSGGGWIYLAYKTLSGSTATGAIDATGGAGGDGGNGTGTGTAGGGGNGGDGGTVVKMNVGAGSSSVTYGSAGSAASGQTGGAGGACSVDL